MASHRCREVKGFPLLIIADCGILNKIMGKIIIQLTKLRNSCRKKKVIEENNESEF